MEPLALEGGGLRRPAERFGQRVIKIADPDGAPVELSRPTATGGPPLDGFHSVTLWER
jgi:glyoxalase family protein